MGLEADDIIDVPRRVVPAKLHHCVRLFSRLRVPESHRLQRAIAQGILAPTGHDLHRHTALKDVFVLKAVDRRFLRRGKLADKGGVFLPAHSTVDIVSRASVVAGGVPGVVHVDGVQRYQRRRRVKEMKVVRLAEILGDSPAHSVGGQRPRCDDDRALRYPGHLLGGHGNIGVGTYLLRHQRGKTVAIHRQAAAGLHTGRVGAGQDQAVQTPKLLFQKPNGIFQPVSPQRVGADQLREIRAVMGRSHFIGLHFKEPDPEAPLGQLPGRLAARKSRADDFYFCHFFFVSFVDFVSFAAFVSGASSSAFSTVSVVALGILRL